MIRPGDRVVILLEDEETRFFAEVSEGKVLATHYGNLIMSSLVGMEYGSFVSLGFKGAYVLKPSLLDGILSLKRSTQIVYPKDIAFITLNLDIKDGDVVYEAGTGTGVMTSVFSRMVGSSGQVVTYEKRSDFVRRARENVAALGKIDRVTFFPEDIENCNEENVADSFFLDVPDPLAVMGRAVSTLKGSGRICVLCPTTNQVQESIRRLGELGVVDIQMWEIMARNYKTNPDRLRPEDRMVGHTAYLVFGVKIKRRSRS